jgi:hypothetical protein
LTAAVHTLSAANPYWDALKDWPEESGGPAALEEIAARCRVMRNPGFKGQRIWVDQMWSVDPILHQLLAPERRRQLNAIVKAIDRVCEIIAAEGNG